jgi:hypothetical protein
VSASGPASLPTPTPFPQWDPVPAMTIRLSLRQLVTSRVVSRAQAALPNTAT